MQLLLIALSYNVKMLSVNLPFVHAFDSRCQVYFSCTIHFPPLMMKVLRVHLCLSTLFPGCWSGRSKEVCSNQTSAATQNFRRKHI